MTREARHLRCPESVLGWIPWYTEGSLNPRQMGAVEAHASECADCRAELDMISGAPFEIDVDLPDPDRLYAEITARIDADDSGAASSVIPIDRARSLSDADLERLGRWVDAGDEAERLDGAAGGADVIALPWLRSRSVAAAAAVVLLFAGGLSGALLSSFSRGSGAEAGSVSSASYELAAAMPMDAPAAGPAIDVIFRDATAAVEISSMLRANGLEIVAGPTKLGVYRLQRTAAAVDANADAGRTVDGREDGIEDPGAAARAIAARLAGLDGPIVIFAEAVP